MRVVVTDQDIQKLALDVESQTVDELKVIVCKHCHMQYEFNMRTLEEFVNFFFVYFCSYSILHLSKGQEVYNMYIKALDF